MIRSELKRAGLHDETAQCDKFIANRVGAMDKNIDKLVASCNTGGVKGFLSLNGAAKALVPEKELALRKERHQAGADPRLHWFLCKDVSQRAAGTKNNFNT